jgi:hypothetical protein
VERRDLGKAADRPHGLEAALQARGRDGSCLRPPGVRRGAPPLRRWAGVPCICHAGPATTNADQAGASWVCSARGRDVGGTWAERERRIVRRAQRADTSYIHIWRVPTREAWRDGAEERRSTSRARRKKMACLHRRRAIERATGVAWGAARLSFYHAVPPTATSIVRVGPELGCRDV